MYRRFGLSIEERFWSHLHAAEAGCWIWTGYKNRSGYGYNRNPFDPEHKFALVHRITYEYFIDLIPDGLVIDHLCKQRICANPTHLEPVTIAENNRRSPNPKKTHCPRGHEYAGTNLRISRAGASECRVCHKMFSAIFEKTRIRERRKHK